MTGAIDPLEPRRVLIADVSSGEIEYPDPSADRTLPLARVLVRDDDLVLGTLDVRAPDALVMAVLRAETETAQLSRGTTTTPLPTDFAPPSRTPRNKDLPLPLVTVAIASFKNVTSTVASVGRVLLSTWPALEVIVVDNEAGSDALSASLASAFHGDPRVRCISEPRQGLSRARNAALAIARGEIIAFTDDDVLVDRHWVAALAAAFDEADDIRCVTGAILPVELSTPAQLLLEEYGGFNKGFRRRIFDATPSGPNASLYPFTAGQFGSGANMAFRTSALREMGGFAVELGAGTPTHGGEDLELLRRVVASGNRLVYEPSALVWHRHRKDMHSLRRQMFRYGVGLAATITKWVVTDRQLALQVARRLPAAARYLLASDSRKNERKSEAFPRELTYLELVGMAVGPIAFFRSARRAYRVS